MNQPVLRVITGDASPDEVAAIIAAVSAIEAERQLAAARAGSAFGSDPRTSSWVDASRRTARSVPSPRGAWRLSGRVPRRFR